MTSGPSRAATIYDVARRAGVSHQTVSRFLTGTGGIRPANRVRVEEALRALNYRTNTTARSLATRRTHRLGALVHELSGTGPGKTMQGASDAARRAGYSLDIVSVDALDGAELDDALATLGSRDLEGVLATAPTDAVHEALQALDLPLPIHIDRGGRRDGGASAVGTRLAVSHLLELGHRRIAHLAGPELWISAQDRSRAYEQSLREAGLPALPLVHGDWSSRSGYAAAPLLCSDPQVTAVVAANDRMALGLLLWLHDNDRRIPEDVSVVGFDDIAEAEFFHPPLTTIKQDFDAMGRAAVLTLIALVEDSSRAESVEYPEPQLVVRASTARPA
ncbi:LacI family DNA-binding transcriptional regulator [Rathayibacter sp. VKM Ac-2803]|uniref:LacI family DNA-binding transcriptional regulator n=1 Tax=unclassified Rathayibacter TaxID=2609250 RepID=UPI00135ABFB0|nr:MULTISPECIES: LacI family DNA-binding transcriptional regulator [unclassified Rathayibacter]MWV47790.1 LacI family DNA-binding transcriptional regulator [Rathayibacter sp. VKM Ac-2803]MWV58999.1 LacI family DNA-binding transcriptional regulator [Rathayibacter sp. VKM Ac-2754]